MNRISGPSFLGLNRPRLRNPYYEKNLVYMLRSYLLGVVAITLVVYLEMVVRQYYYPPEQQTPFSSPAFAGIACGIIYPVLNLPVLIVLHKYQLNVIETIVENIFFVNLSYHLDGIIIHLFPSSRVWRHKIVNGLEIWGWEDAWWYSEGLVIVYSICLTIMLCFLFMKIKQSMIQNKTKV